MAMRPLRLYLAGGLFTIGERMQNAQLAGYLRAAGYDCFVPQETEANLRVGEDKTARTIYEADRFGLDWCDVVVACIDGPDPDSGTSWELGYGTAKGKLSVLYRTDFRSCCGDFDGQVCNLMLTVSAERVIAWDRPMTITELVDALKEALEGLRL